MLRNASVISISLIVLLLEGCATQTKGEPLQLGPDTYSTSVPFYPGAWARPDLKHSSSAAYQAALSEAKTYCAGLGKELLVTNTRKGVEDVEVIFRCLSKGDPELVRPVYRETPDTVIEDRRNK